MENYPIPNEVLQLAQHTLPQNDGWSTEGAREHLKTIRDYINKVLEAE